MSDLHFATTIKGSPEAIFATIEDLAGYHRWLPGSASFTGITEISNAPIGVGTTYVDAGPSGIRRGTVVEYASPTAIAFHQPMTVTGPLRGTIDIKVRCTLEAIGDETRVVRDVSVRPLGLLVLAQPLIIATIRRENERLLAALKDYIER
jgi:uncharacterized protein YndB with AHSA1/START domain